MNVTEKITHAAERKAFETMLDTIIKKSQTQDVGELFESLVNMVQKIHGSVWSPETFDTLRKISEDPNGKWAHYVQRLLRECDPYILKTFLTNAAYEGGFRGYQQAQKNAEKYGCNIPWLILMDPTSACNMHCTGCWAAEYGNKLNLSFDEIDDIIRQGKEMGIYMYIYTGGEPLVRKKDLIRLCEKHDDCIFLCFTNATLIDEAFADEMLRVRNFVPAISLEGDEAATDGRRGQGTYRKVLRAMELLHERKLLYGISSCYTSANYDSITSEEYYDQLIRMGAYFIWYFHYMPVGNDAAPELLPSPEQRETVYRRIRKLRAEKPLFAMDFQNDAEYVGGCIAGGRRYLHINAGGDVDPCVFIHYSNANIREVSLLEALQSPIFMAYHDNMPFNDNMMRPCPMLENPEKLRAMVAETGAHSTDPQSPETAEHLCAKCDGYAACWKPEADRLWAERQAEKAAKAGK